MKNYLTPASLKSMRKPKKSTLEVWACNTCAYSCVVGKNGLDTQCPVCKKGTLEQRKKRSKYKNIKVKLHGLMFDSIGEAARYIELDRLKTVTHIQTQVKYPLFAGIDYVADFVYCLENQPGTYVVEDLKGMWTPVFRMKAKMFRERYGFDILLTKPMDSKKARLLVMAANGKILDDDKP